jgi:hypothetical protein
MRAVAVTDVDRLAVVDIPTPVRRDTDILVQSIAVASAVPIPRPSTATSRSRCPAFLPVARVLKRPDQGSLLTTQPPPSTATTWPSRPSETARLDR